jgi:hypothetical protein
MLIQARDGFTFQRLESNCYQAQFSAINPQLCLKTIATLDLIKCIFELNRDVYESCTTVQHSRTEITMTLVMKPLFKDLGLPQRFSHVHITQEPDQYIQESIKNTDMVRRFTIRPISERPLNVPEHAVSVMLRSMTCVCEFPTIHSCLFTSTIEFQPTLVILPFMETLMSSIIQTLFKRVKRFIETTRV